MTARTLLVSLLCVGTVGLVVTTPQAQAPTAAPTDALLKDLKWRNLGPANMAGRVTDIDAVESNPAIVYVAAASGGVWKSVNAGTTWEPIFTNYGTSSIGDVTIFQKDPNIVWVGSGEGCVRNSASWGDGVYKSTDGGKTFTNMGLAETHHIPRIITHPTNPDIVYVAAQGHLWGYNHERGVYKTTDGGKTWKKLAGGLPQDDKTGAGDLIMDPANPNVLYASMWERIRKPYVFESGGPNGGLYKSTNGGDTWTKLGGGLPAGSVGKIGLTVYRRNGKILTAIVESPRGTDAKTPGPGIYRSEDAGATWTFMNASADRPFYYNHIYLDPNNANRLFVLQVPARVSEDGGKTFGRTLPGIEGDFHAMWIDPSNSDRFYVSNDKGASVTYDGGRNFIMFDNMDIGQFYAVTADNRDPYWLYGGLQDSGNWGGPSNSRDYNGILGDHWFKFHSGDGFHTTVDPEDWRIVYTETQNGSVRRLDATFRQQGEGVSPRPATIMNYEDVSKSEGGNPRFRYNWSSPLILSPHDSKTLYLGGNYLMRSTNRGESWEIISPDLSTKDAELISGPGPAMGERGGAETHATIISIVESALVRGLIWAGTDDGNVQVTRDAGKTWTNVRPNIPRNLVPPGTWVSRVEPSHFDPGTVFVSFDGHRRDDMKPYVLKSTDYGRTWASLVNNLPAKSPVYVVKEDLKNPNLLFAGNEIGAYASIDGGTSWRRLNGLPIVPVHDLVIHPRQHDLIAATHGRSLWVLDDITPLQQLTPAVLESDAYLFQNKVATIWNAVSRGATRGHLMFQGRNPLTIAARAPLNSPTELANSATITFYLKAAPAEPVQMEIASLDGARTVTLNVPATAGINRYFWDMRFAAAGGAGGGRGGGRGGGGRGGDAGAAGAAGAAGGGQRAGGAGRAAGAGDPDAADAPAPAAGGGAVAAPGTYRVKITTGGKTLTTTLTVRADPLK
ncbi:MAG TPA: hypothetical protein VN700_12185 [Vicinamibacterales bacterium]|nr:hypothetical protein [Vicinamibacterales bacterium]